MDFSQVFTKQFLLTHEGRINRQPYWAFILVLVGVNIALGILHMKALSGLVGLAILYPAVLVQIKRWHDRGKSGWWCLINLVPVIGWLWALVECGFLPGTSGANAYGADPLASKPAT